MVGFKQTDIGRIPVDWEVKKIGDVCKLINGRGFKPYEWKNEGLPIIRIQNINGSSDYNHYQGSYDKKIEVEKGQFLFAWSGNRGTSFGPHIWKGSLGLLNYHTWKVIVNERGVIQEFFFHAIKELTKFIEEKAHGASALVHTQKWEMEGFKFPLPPLPEQEAIAQVLSDTDALITTLEKRIEKKRLIKQGAMQTLLTPKDDWEVKKLPDVCWFQEGPGVRKSQFTLKGVKLLNGTNIEKGKLLLDKTERYVSEKEAYGWYSHFLVDNGDILIACSGVSIDKFHEKVTIADNNHLPLCMNTSTMRFKIKTSTLIKSYLIHFLKSKDFKQQISGKATGSAQLNFGPSHVSKLLINLPPIEEQTRIATILSDMDSEIVALEQKLTKTKQLKQGLMQQLLTGKIRLV